MQSSCHVNMQECWQAIEQTRNRAIMKTIAVISQKGRAGKTTIALNLAVAAVRSGHQCAVIDIDPQVSAKYWHDLRQDKTADPSDPEPDGPPPDREDEFRS
jgi:cellulose biosynthesis protein BcsQ